MVFSVRRISKRRLRYPVCVSGINVDLVDSVDGIDNVEYVEEGDKDNGDERKLSYSVWTGSELCGYDDFLEFQGWNGGEGIADGGGHDVCVKPVGLHVLRDKDVYRQYGDDSPDRDFLYSLGNPDGDSGIL